MAKKKKTFFLSLTKANYILFGIAVAVLFIGYIFLSKGPANSTSSLTIAPLLLLFGYCILVPLSIFWKTKKSGD